MRPEEFIERLKAREILYLIGSGRTVFLKLTHGDEYILSTTDESFLVVADTFKQLTIDERMIFFYDFSSNESRLAFQTMTDRWEI